MNHRHRVAGASVLFVVVLIAWMAVLAGLMWSGRPVSAATNSFANMTAITVGPRRRGCQSVSFQYRGFWLDGEHPRC
ncbi:MAG: hypothetical protein KatS3mg051_0321 [Anaerolineae bacterium]|nr:MAG: hypothetical protein KatS3mg051_0321 [Anaerolineae bacterium]